MKIRDVLGPLVDAIDSEVEAAGWESSQYFINENEYEVTITLSYHKKRGKDDEHLRDGAEKSLTAVLHGTAGFSPYPR